jgi:hypothetical protein
MSSAVIATITTRRAQQLIGQLLARRGRRQVDMDTGDARRPFWVIASTWAFASGDARPNPITCVTVANARDTR